MQTKKLKNEGSQRQTDYKRVSDFGQFWNSIVELDTESLDLYYIKKHWKELTGTLGLHSQAIKFDKNYLTVITDHSAYIHELKLLERDIINQIKNKINIKISKIIVKKAKLNWQEEDNPDSFTNEIKDNQNTDLIEQLKKI